VADGHPAGSCFQFPLNRGYYAARGAHREILFSLAIPVDYNVPFLQSSRCPLGVGGLSRALIPLSPAVVFCVFFPRKRITVFPFPSINGGAHSASSQGFLNPLRAVFPRSVERSVLIVSMPPRPRPRVSPVLIRFAPFSRGNVKNFFFPFPLIIPAPLRPSSPRGFLIRLSARFCPRFSERFPLPLVPGSPPPPSMFRVLIRLARGFPPETFEPQFPGSCPPTSVSFFCPRFLSRAPRAPVLACCSQKPGWRAP